MKLNDNFRMIGLVLILSLLLAISACAKKQVVVAGDAGEAAKGSEAMVVVSAPVAGSEESKGSSEGELFESENIFFAFDKYALSEESRAVLEKKAAWLKSNDHLSVTIEGHCDERGSETYNLALGERRAQASKNYLVNLGILAERITTISYGEELPADSGHDENAWAKNRRGQFRIVQK